MESLRNILPDVFAYDHSNYAKHMTVMRGKMLNLEESHPNIYREFVAGNFYVQLSPHSFSRVEANKVIEATMNQNTKTPDGFKSFSTKTNTVNR